MAKSEMTREEYSSKERVRKTLTTEHPRNILFSDTRTPTEAEYEMVAIYWNRRMNNLINKDKFHLNKMIKVDKYEGHTLFSWISDGMYILLGNCSDDIAKNIRNTIRWFCGFISIGNGLVDTPFQIIYNTDIADIKCLSDDIVLLLIRDMLCDLASLISSHMKFVTPLIGSIIKEDMLKKSDSSDFYIRLFDFSDSKSFETYKAIIAEESEEKKYMTLVRYGISHESVFKYLQFNKEYPDYDGNLYGADPYIYKLGMLIEKYKEELNKYIVRLSFKNIENLYCYLDDALYAFGGDDDTYSPDYIMYNNLDALSNSIILEKTNKDETVIYDDCCMVKDYGRIDGKFASMYRTIIATSYGLIEEVYDCICDILNSAPINHNYGYII